MPTRDMPCPRCGHDHLWLDCEWCDCVAHEQTGVYSAAPDSSRLLSTTNPVNL